MIRALGLVALLAVPTTIAITLAARTPEAAADEADWRWIRPQQLQLVGRLTSKRLAEASGVATSRTNPGIFWVVTDGGNDPELLAIDSTGELRGTLPIGNAENVDWEEVAVGRCGEATCIYIADTGDNRERRPEVAIHRVIEPELPPEKKKSSLRKLRVETLRLSYPDGPHDVEAMGVLPDGALLLVSKGRSGGVLAFRVAADAWGTSRTVIAERVDSLPITASRGNGRVVTGMAISSDGSRVMVRTYRDLFPFMLSEGRRFTPLGAPTACDVLGAEPQGEAVTWLEGGRLLLVSERGLFTEGTVYQVECEV